MKTKIVTNLNESISENFRWKEALYQKQWGLFIIPNEEQTINIRDMAFKLELIRELFGDRPITVTSWLRCPRYNFDIGGAKESWHMKGGGVDFTIKGIKAHVVRDKLEEYLDVFNLRMERLEETDQWVHVDNKPVGESGRYFNP